MPMTAEAIGRPLSVGQVEIANRAFLAPMTGVTDLPFRTLASRLGAGLVVSEMIASEALVKARPDMVRRARGEGIAPYVIQLAGCEARWMAEGARLAANLGAGIVDINMGCPAKLVTRGQSGSALMRDLNHALTLIEAVVGAVSLPVTLKMRLGWDEASMNAPELAKRAEQAGVKLITVHGRTRCQFFKGRADWRAIARVKQAVSIPVIANGDVNTLDDAGAIIAASGADGVMIGRGAYGAPWLPGRIAAFLRTGKDPGEPSLPEQQGIAIEHYDAMLEHYGSAVGSRVARKHLGWYLDRGEASIELRKAWRKRLCQEERPARVRALLAESYAERQERMH